MRKNQVIGAMLMAVMTLFALPSCDKDETCEGEKTETPKDATAIEKATLGKKVLVDEIADANTITWLETDKFKDFAAKTAKFCNQAAVAIGMGDNGNIAVSPVSVFMALAMSADCANGDTQKELTDALGVTIDELRTMNMRSLCYLFNRTLDRPINPFNTSSTDPYSTSPDKAKSLIKCVNSLWVRGDVPVKEDELKELNRAYYADVLSMDFANTNVNELVSSYISNETNGLIKPTFEFDENTAILLMNVVYLRDIWDRYGVDLPLTDEKYDFVCTDNTKKNVNLLRASYLAGRKMETEAYRKFYTKTNGGLELTFFVPKVGHTLADVYTEAVLNDNTPYVYEDATSDPEHKYKYYTRCLFPEFEAKFDSKIQDAVKKMGVEKFFDEFACDFSNLTDHDVFCRNIIHITKLEVARKGIEGAAVTVVEMGENAANIEIKDEDWEYVYEDFVVDRDFAYVLSMDGVPVFTGVVRTIE